MSRIFSVAVVSGALCLLGGSAHAVSVSNDDGGVTQLFFDDFESSTPGSAPTGANPGTWVTPGSEVSQVLTGGTPGAAQGANYLGVTRPDAGSNNFGISEATFSQQAAGMLHAEWMMNIPARTAQEFPWVNPNLKTGPGTSGSFYVVVARAVELTMGSPVVQNYDGTGYVSTGMTYTPDQWEKWSIDYLIGSTSYTLSVGSQSVSGLQASAAGAVGSLSFEHQNYPQTYFIDAVPEPAMLGLLAPVVLMLRRRRPVAG